jgi:hypothetical protein
LREPTVQVVCAAGTASQACRHVLV